MCCIPCLWNETKFSTRLRSEDNVNSFARNMKSKRFGRVKHDERERGYLRSFIVEEVPLKGTFLGLSINLRIRTADPIPGDTLYVFVTVAITVGHGNTTILYCRGTVQYFEEAKGVVLYSTYSSGMTYLIKFYLILVTASNTNWTAFNSCYGCCMRYPFWWNMGMRWPLRCRESHPSESLLSNVRNLTSNIQTVRMCFQLGWSTWPCFR